MVSSKLIHSHACRHITPGAHYTHPKYFVPWEAITSKAPPKGEYTRKI